MDILTIALAGVLALLVIMAMWLCLKPLYCPFCDGRVEVKSVEEEATGHVLGIVANCPACNVFLPPARCRWRFWW